jgi:hypothetical protein
LLLPKARVFLAIKTIASFNLFGDNPFLLGVFSIVARTECDKSTRTPNSRGAASVICIKLSSLASLAKADAKFEGLSSEASVFPVPRLVLDVIYLGVQPVRQVLDKVAYDVRS